MHEGARTDPCGGRGVNPRPYRDKQLVRWSRTVSHLELK